MVRNDTLMPDKKLIDSELYEQIEYWQRGYNDLIQQIKEAHANIERLNKTNENLLRQLCRKVNRESKVIEKLIKTEAYKECIEKVRKLAVGMHPCSDELRIFDSDLDNILKEIGVENNGNS